MNKEQLIQKYEEQLKKLRDFENDYHQEKIQPSSEEFHDKMLTKQHLVVFINDLKKLDLSDVIKSVCDCELSKTRDAKWYNGEHCGNCGGLIQTDL